MPESEPRHIDRFQVKETLGQGGFGRVFRAYDPLLNRNVALKMIRPERVGSPGTRERLRREAKAAARLVHRSIVQVFELVELEGGEGDVIVMEYVQGKSLADHLRDGPIDITDSIRLLREISEGLAAAHREGIIHRDLKAENVIITQEGQAKILDFGLAKSGGDVSLTSEGQVIGTVYCMSPEQVEGREVDARSDLFALGALAYHMLTGEMPFRGSDLRTTVARILTKDPGSVSESNPKVSSELSQLVDQLLEKEPQQRPESAQSVADRLTQIAGESPILPLPTPQGPLNKCDGLEPTKDKPAGSSTITIPVPARRRYSLVRVLASLAILAVLGFAGWELLHFETSMVAVLGFDSAPDVPVGVSGGLAELLAAHLGNMPDVRLVDEERVAIVKHDLSEKLLSLDDPDGLAPETLKRLGQHLSADLLVLGEVHQEGDQLNAVLRMQDTGTGKVVWEASTGTADDVFSLAETASRLLRKEWGLGEPPVNNSEHVRALFPEDPEAASLYFAGRELLRADQDDEAMTTLESSIQEERHPKTLTALAAAYVEAGYPADAKKAADLSRTQAAEWPRRERLRIEGRCHEFLKEWEEAANVYADLYQEYGNAEDGLRLIDAQVRRADTNNGQEDARQALAMIVSLRPRTPSRRSQARLDLYEAMALHQLGDSAACRNAARRAVVSANEIQAVSLHSRALFRYGGCLEELGEGSEALHALDEAWTAFEKEGYRTGVLDAFHRMALIHTHAGDYDQAERDLERIRDFFQNDPAAFRAVTHLSNTLFERGQLNGVEKTLRQALDKFNDLTSRDLADVDMTLGNVELLRGNLREAEDRYRKARTAYEALNDTFMLPKAITNLGEVAFSGGRLDESMALHRESLTMRGENAYDLYRIGQVLAAQGDLDGAAQQYERAFALWGNDLTRRQGEWILLARAEVEFGRHNVGLASELSQRAADSARKIEIGDDAVLAQAFHLRMELRRGNFEKVTKSAQTVFLEADRRQSWPPRFAARLLEAELHALTGGEEGAAAAALQALDQSVNDAAERGYGGYVLEARLSQAQVELWSDRRDDALRRLREIARMAESQGYGSIVARARSMTVR